MGSIATLPIRGTRSKLSLPGNLFHIYKGNLMHKICFCQLIDEGLTSSSTVIPSSSMVNLPSILQDTRRKASKVKQVNHYYCVQRGDALTFNFSKAFRRPRRPRTSQPTSTKDLGRWKPTDDLSLITAVQQVILIYQTAKRKCAYRNTFIDWRSFGCTPWCEIFMSFHAHRNHRTMVCSAL